MHAYMQTMHLHLENGVKIELKFAGEHGTAYSGGTHGGAIAQAERAMLFSMLSSQPILAVDSMHLQTVCGQLQSSTFRVLFEDFPGDLQWLGSLEAFLYAVAGVGRMCFDSATSGDRPLQTIGHIQEKLKSHTIHSH